MNVEAARSADRRVPAVAVAGALGVAQRALEQRGRRAGRSGRRRRGSKSIRCGRSRCRTTGCSADDRRRGRRQDHVWIIHRADRSTPTEAAADQNPPTGVVLRTAPPVLEFDPGRQPRRARGAARARATSGPTSNHGIHVDNKGNVWIGGNGANDAPRPEVHQGRQVPDAVRQAGQATPAATTLSTSAAWRRSSSTEDQRGLHRRRLRQQARRRASTPTPASSSATGAPTATSRTTRTSAATTRPRRPRSSSATRCTAPSCRTTASSTSATAPNDRIQVFTPDGKFVKEVFIAKNTLGDGSVWDIAFSKDPQQKYIYLADGKNEKIYIIDRAVAARC